MKAGCDSIRPHERARRCATESGVTPHKRNDCQVLVSWCVVERSREDKSRIADIRKTGVGCVPNEDYGLALLETITFNRHFSSVEN